MITIQKFTFNPFAENTYVLYDQSKECIIVDPGCNSIEEQNQLVGFLDKLNLQPKILFNTHCHIDHILGNQFIQKKYNLNLTSHKGEQEVLNMQSMVSQMYNIPYQISPNIEIFVDEADKLTLGNSTVIEILDTPGHSPASICLYHPESHCLIGGDVLFKEGIGRTDLPGGNMTTLLNSIRNKIFVLPKETTVYPGHGPSTTVGYELQNNPFFR